MVHYGYDGHAIRRPSFIFGVPSRHALPDAIGFITYKKRIKKMEIERRAESSRPTEYGSLSYPVKSV